MVRFTVLGSGSSGNCALVRTDDTCLLIDAGLSARQICQRLESVGSSIDQIDGIFLTHEHGDHTRGLEVLSASRTLPIFCTALTQETLLGSIKFRQAPKWRLMNTGTSFAFRDLHMECFPVQHDAVDPVGYLIANEVSRLGVLSDVGFITHLIKDRLKGVDSVFIEANYDTRLLDADTKRPWATKQRISSRHGHLSNDQAAELIECIAHPAMNHVVLGHLSEDCNAPDVAMQCIRRALESAGAAQASVHCAGRSQPTPLFDAARPRPQGALFASVPEPVPRQMALF